MRSQKREPVTEDLLRASLREMDLAGREGTELQRVVDSAQLVAVNCTTTTPPPPQFFSGFRLSLSWGEKNKNKKTARSLYREIKGRRGRRKNCCQGTYPRKKTESINVVLYSFKEVIGDMTCLLKKLEDELRVF